MSNMFYYCRSLTTLNVGSFDTTKVTTMAGMFMGCSSLTELDLSNFITTNLTNVGRSYINEGMFSNCSNLTILDIRKFTFDKVKDHNLMFYKSSALTKIIIKDDDNVETFINARLSEAYKTGVTVERATA